MLTCRKLEHTTPFKRKIHPDEIWLYRNPRTTDYVPISILWPVVFVIPLLVIILNFIINRDRNDVSQSIFGFTLAIGLNGVITDTIKLIVGRPRPDFFWRCFPDGEMNTEMECSGDAKSVMDGRKSFPSGHSSCKLDFDDCFYKMFNRFLFITVAFASMGFLAWYLMGKLHIFSEAGRGKSWRLMISLIPLVAALMVALSRTCDYHHHWQDVVIGSLIGLSLSYLCYRQYYPNLGLNVSHRPYVSIQRSLEKSTHSKSVCKEDDLKQIVESESKDTKWI